MSYASTQRAWWVQVVQAGGAAIREAFGAVRISDRLHWTQAEARAEAEKFCAELATVRSIGKRSPMTA
jgi:hypothetical protein